VNFRQSLHFYRQSKSQEKKAWVDVLKFAFRSFLYWGVGAKWNAYLARSPWVKDAAQCGRLMEKIHRPFFSQTLNQNQKLVLLIQSHQALIDVFSAQFLVLAAKDGGVKIANIVAKHSTDAYYLSLSTDPQFSREGVLVLNLSDARGRLISLAFSLAGTFAGADKENRAALIGCLQSSAHQGAERIRLATHELYGIQPRFLLLNALRLLVQRLSMQKIEAISDANHVYNSWRYKRRHAKIYRSYDAFWRTVGVQAINGNYHLDTEIKRKPIESYPSKKRSEHRHRYELLDGVELEFSGFLNSHVHH
jgi:uncharacterized protein